MESFLLNAETEFFFLTGTYLEGFIGLVLGLTLFCLVIQALRFEIKKNDLDKNGKKYVDQIMISVSNKIINIQ